MFWTKTANSLQPCKDSGTLRKYHWSSSRVTSVYLTPPAFALDKSKPISLLCDFTSICLVSAQTLEMFGLNNCFQWFFMACTATHQPLSVHHQWKNEQTSCWVVNILHVLYRWCHSFQAPVFWLNSSEGVPMNSLLTASRNLSRLAPKCIIAESYETIWADAASLVRAIISLISLFSTQALPRYGNTLTYNPEGVKR